MSTQSIPEGTPPEVAWRWADFASPPRSPGMSDAESDAELVAAYAAGGERALQEEAVRLYHARYTEWFVTNAVKRVWQKERAQVAVVKVVAQQQRVDRALRNYEQFHGMPPGTATLDQVSSSSAGAVGWSIE